MTGKIITDSSAPTKPISQTYQKYKRRLRLRLPMLWMWIGIGLFILLSVAVVGLFVRKSPIPAELTVNQAYSMYREGAFFLDVRTPAEWNKMHIPNTNLIPLDELSLRLKEVPKEREIVVVCRSGNRSLKARNLLKRAGYINVTSMVGGIREWLLAGHPVVEDKP